MFGLGMQEIIIILVVALLIIGPKKLPDLARSLGKALREFKGAADDFKHNLEIEPHELTPRSNIKTTHKAPAKETIETVPENNDKTLEEKEEESSIEAEAEMVTEDIKETKDQDTINNDK